MHGTRYRWSHVQLFRLSGKGQRRPVSGVGSLGLKLKASDEESAHAAIEALELRHFLNAKQRNGFMATSFSLFCPTRLGELAAILRIPCPTLGEFTNPTIGRPATLMRDPKPLGANASPLRLAHEAGITVENEGLLIAWEASRPEFSQSASYLSLIAAPVIEAAIDATLAVQARPAHAAAWLKVRMRDEVIRGLS